MLKLPFGVFKAVVEEYLHADVQQLSDLDIAVCNHEQRSDLLVRLQQVKAAMPDGETWGSYSSQSLVEYLHWVASRGVTVPELRVNVSALEGGLASGHPINIETVYVFDRSTEPIADNVVANMIGFLNRFPCLKLLAIHKCSLRDEQVMQLKSLQCRVEGLDFYDCAGVSSAAIAAIACAFGSSLHVLKCDGMGDDDMTALAAHCSQLTAIDIGCSSLTSSTAFEHLCAASARTLKTIALGGLATDAILRIATACVNLERFEIGLEDDGDAITVVLQVLSHCPQAASVKVGDLDVTIATDEHGQRVADLVQQGTDEIADMLTLLTDIPIPLRGCDIKFSDATAVAMLGSLHRFGGTLLKLHLCSNLQVTNNHAIVALLRLCPNLTDFKLSVYSKDGLLESLVFLPAACAGLRKVAIAHIYAFRYENVTPLLNAFKAVPNQVTQFALPWRSELTIATLNTIAEAFPRLFTLSLSGNLMNITIRDEIVALIVSGKLTAKRISIWDASALKWIVERLERRGIDLVTVDECIWLSFK